MKVRSILIIVFFISACHAPQEGTDMAVTKIERMSADRAAAFNEGDAARIAQHFSEDGLLMAPDSETLTGRNAVEGYYQAIFDEYETSLDSYYEEVRVSDDLAFGRGIADVRLIHKASGDTTYSTSKYLNILQRTGEGEWITTHDIWNTVN